jgi:RNA polymerase sigma-70 factor (ECF subfamily)
MDRELVVRARDGDHDAFSMLAAASIGRLNGLARLIVHDHLLAEDAVQDALVAAWRDLRGLREPDRFDAWLNRLLVRACQNASKRDWRRRIVELPLGPTDGSAISDRQAALAIADELERGLRQLTMDQRTVLVLIYYLDLPLAEAAATLGIPVGTMKSRLNRAISALRASIEADARPTKLTPERLA